MPEIGVTLIASSLVGGLVGWLAPDGYEIPAWYIGFVLSLFVSFLLGVHRTKG